MTTSRSEPARTVLRFSRASRWAHWATAALTAICLATAAMLYLGPLAQLVGRRHLVETTHIYAGLALPVPMLLAAVSAAYRRDVSALNRFSPADWAWLRALLRASLRTRPPTWMRPRTRQQGASSPLPHHPDATTVRPPIAVGKFNPGQKLYAAFVAGWIAVLLGTGLIMQFGSALAVGYRTGATFVHDLLAFALAVAVAGHLWMASRDPVARLGMRSGVVPRWWAAREHPGWLGADTDEAATRARQAPLVQPGDLG